MLKCLKLLLLSGNDVSRFRYILTPKRHSRGNPVSQSYHPQGDRGVVEVDAYDFSGD
jgi:hypothetical protein